MRNPGGWVCITEPDAPVVEMDTFTCGHCNKVVQVKVKASPDELGGYCYCCTKMVCPLCVGKGCDPFEKKLERMEASYHARRSYQCA